MTKVIIVGKKKSLVEAMRNALDKGYIPMGVEDGQSIPEPTPPVPTFYLNPVENPFRTSNK